jgi:putative ABC transport system permease protein
MSLRDLLYETWFSLSANKARSLLTVLGIVIGIASVIMMTSLIGGMQNMLMAELGMFQSRMVQINAMTPLMQEDVDALADAFPEYELIAPLSGTVAVVSTTEESVDAQVAGATPENAVIFNTEVAAGRFLIDDDVQRATRVIVLGRGAVRDLFGDPDAQVVGEKVRVGPNAESYTIVGILAGEGMSSNYNAYIIPASTMHLRLTGQKSYSAIAALAKEDVNVTELAARTSTFLSERISGGRGDDQSVIVLAMQDLLATVDLVITAFTFMIGAIASISLFVGGIGIMNMMLTNVTERTREIGLRKSLGAHTSDITKQFLAEAIALCLVGGLLGILFGYLGAFGLAAIVNLVQNEINFAPAIGVQAVLIAVGVCAVIGIVFGYYPARRAAKLDPVESLRYQ